MFDTILFRLNQIDVPKTSFLEETTCYFKVTGEHKYNKGKNLVLSGSLDGLKIAVSEDSFRIKEGSLCKWFLGNNIESLGRRDTKLAVEKLSDLLHLPMDKAFIYRLDIAYTFAMKYPVDVYYNHLGILKGYKRMPVNFKKVEGFYLFQNDNNKRKVLAFYDKLKEQKGKIPDTLNYQTKHLLRYEQRYKKGYFDIFNKQIRAKMLYDNDCYKKIILLWKKDYDKIGKINDISLNFDVLKGKRDLFTMGLLILINRQGGELEFLSQIHEAQQMGQISKKQAFDMRNLVKDSCILKTGFTVQNDCIIELDKKIDEVVTYYISKE